MKVKGKQGVKRGKEYGRIRKGMIGLKGSALR